ncbi:hypothetical protein K0M31_014273 [Melipona bicolor]|uniref:Uncharacterized protein n=1 Tax=Melipona bicolor TaxID=60889 RepID=A0AA40G8Y0_9HYME|nr:hypothetical protein K0M31_014273 [Melipona bicolor]
MKTSFGVLPRDCRMIVVAEPRGRPADVSPRPNQTTPEAVRDNQPSNNLPPSECSVAWMANQNTTLRPFRDPPQFTPNKDGVKSPGNHVQNYPPNSTQILQHINH